MAFSDTIARAYALARGRSNTSIFFFVCVLYILLQIYLKELYLEIARILSNFIVFNISFLVVAKYYLHKALKAAKYGCPWSLLHFANVGLSYIRVFELSLTKRLVCRSFRRSLHQVVGNWRPVLRISFRSSGHHRYHLKRMRCSTHHHRHHPKYPLLYVRVLGFYL